MGQTIRRNYVQYSTDSKRLVVMLANVGYMQVTQLADLLDIHPVLIYRWRKQLNDGELVDKPVTRKRKKPSSSPDRSALQKKDDELRKAEKKIKQLEKKLKRTEEDVDILKKAERFFKKHRT